MAIAESILPEFDHETATTRTLLERMPAEKAEWRPMWSMSLGKLAMHTEPSELGNYHARERTEFDTNPPDGPSVTTPKYESECGCSRSTTRT